MRWDNMGWYAETWGTKLGTHVGMWEVMINNCDSNVERLWNNNGEAFGNVGEATVRNSNQANQHLWCG